MITIYGDPGSRAARCLWALEELGVDYVRQSTDLPDGGGRSPAYLAINPSGKVPLVVDDDVTISESYAINLYLATRYGRGSLWPDDVAGQAAGLQWSFWVATETEPFIAALYAERFLKSNDDRSEQELDRLEAGLANRLAFLDQALGGRSNLYGGIFTIADLNVAAGLRNATKLQVSLDAHPQVERWLSACLARPAHLHVLEMG
ncbi:MAG: glutathione S-transferase family protein [Sphingomicrobium sp.]